MSNSHELSDEGGQYRIFWANENEIQATNKYTCTFGNTCNLVAQSINNHKIHEHVLSVNKSQ